jgi:hypothetical protein
MSKVPVKVSGLNVFPKQVQASKTDVEVYRTQSVEALLIFFAFFFSSAALLYLHFPFTFFSYFVKSGAKSEYNSSQSTNTLSASDTDSLLNIVHLILQSKPL